MFSLFAAKYSVFYFFYFYWRTFFSKKKTHTLFSYFVSICDINILSQWNTCWLCFSSNAIFFVWFLRIGEFFEYSSENVCICLYFLWPLSIIFFLVEIFYVDVLMIKLKKKENFCIIYINLTNYSQGESKVSIYFSSYYLSLYLITEGSVEVLCISLI